MKNYHNTTPLYGEELSAAVRAAESQDAAVLVVMAGGRVWSPSMLEAYFKGRGRNWPITSIRRALSNLTKAGKLTMTGRTMIGPMGRRENTWASVQTSTGESA